MRSWASWTAKAALLAAGFAAACGGLSGVALAASGGSAESGAGSAPGAGLLIAPPVSAATPGARWALPA